MIVRHREAKRYFEETHRGCVSNEKFVGCGIIIRPELIHLRARRSSSLVRNFQGDIILPHRYGNLEMERDVDNIEQGGRSNERVYPCCVERPRNHRSRRGLSERKSANEPFRLATVPHSCIPQTAGGPPSFSRVLVHGDFGPTPNICAGTFHVQARC